MTGQVETSLRLASWLAVAVVGVVMLTQAFGVDAGDAVAVAQTLTPYATLCLVPIAALALARRWWGLGATAALAGLGGVLLAVPILVAPRQAAPDPAAEPIEIAALNLLYENDRTAEIADRLAELDVDVIVFTEYTAEHQAGLLAHPLVERYPHRVELDGLGAGGTAVWSAVPLARQPDAELANYDVDVRVEAPSASFRLWAVHPPTPFHDRWRSDLRTIADRAAEIDEPLVIAGDFNASYWHPAFRDILRSGLTSAHHAAGSGWSVSWPTGGRVPPFVRIDHALTTADLVSTGVRDFTVPGSDHRGLVVTIVPAA